MSKSFNIVIRDLDTGAARTGLTVQYFYNVDNFTLAQHTAVEIGGRPGVYQVQYDTWVNALYRIKVNGSFDPAFGGDNGVWIIDGDNIISLNGDGLFDAKSKRIINVANAEADGDALSRGAADDRYLLLSGGQMSGLLDMTGQLISNVGDAQAAGDAVSRGFGDYRYLLLSGGSMLGALNMDGQILTGLPLAVENTDAVSLAKLIAYLASEAYAKEGAQNIFTEPNTFTNETAFSNYPPLCDVDPSNDNHLARRVWVIEQINNSASPYQESINVIRLMPGGIQQTNKVYTSWSAASNAARLLAGDLRRMTVEIRGAGDGGATIIPSDGGISGNNVFNSYVSYKGINQNVLLELAGTGTFGANVGTIISDLTFYCDDPDADITFTGFVFNNVYFNFQDSTALNFNSCTFRGCDIKVVAGSAAYTNCKGGNVVTNTDLPDEISGWGGKDPNDF